MLQFANACADWPEHDTEIHNAQQPVSNAALALDMSGATRSGGDHLWEDNWDDDDIEDNFSKALRYVEWTLRDTDAQR